MLRPRGPAVLRARLPTPVRAAAPSSSSGWPSASGGGPRRRSCTSRCRRPCCWRLGGGPRLRTSSRRTVRRADRAHALGRGGPGGRRRPRRVDPVVVRQRAHRLRLDPLELVPGERRRHVRRPALRLLPLHAADAARRAHGLDGHVGRRAGGRQAALRRGARPDRRGRRARGVGRREPAHRVRPLRDGRWRSWSTRSSTPPRRARRTGTTAATASICRRSSCCSSPRRC